MVSDLNIFQMCVVPDFRLLREFYLDIYDDDDDMCWNYFMRWFHIDEHKV